VNSAKAISACPVGCSRVTGKPEVIPETESLHYLQKSQGRPRRRILSTRLVLTSLLVCAKCAQQACTRLLRIAPISRQRQMQVAETAGGLGVARVWLHTQNPPGFGPWGFDSPSRHQRFQRSYFHCWKKWNATLVAHVCAKCAQSRWAKSSLHRILALSGVVFDHHQ
jgi:hypothetical protein